VLRTTWQSNPVFGGVSAIMAQFVRQMADPAVTASLILPSDMTVRHSICLHSVERTRICSIAAMWRRQVIG
jgi:hypothetical protein